MTASVPSRTSLADRVSFAALGVTVLLMPFPIIVGVARDPADPTALAGVFLSDVPLAVLAALQVPHVARRLRRRAVGAIAIGSLALLVLTAIALAFHPSLAGAQFLLRGVGMLAVAAAVTRLDGARVPPGGPMERALVATLVSSTLIQAGIAAAQLAAGGPIGLDALGERQTSLTARGGDRVPVPRGTMVHEYSLTVLALVTAMAGVRLALRSAHPLGWLVPAAIGLVPVAFTYSRSALAALAAAALALVPRAVRRDPAARYAIVALSSAILLGAAGAGGTWIGRIAPGLNLDPEHVACQRLTLLGHAADILATSPVVGVGPGRYTAVLRDRLGPGAFEGCVMTPHSVPVLVAAEDGVVAAALLVALLVGLGWRALRAGPAATGMFLAFLPYVLIDDFPFHVHGIVLAGLWLGFLELARREPEPWTLRAEGGAPVARSVG